MSDDDGIHAFARGSNTFGLDLWRRLPASGNRVFSPASISTALVMAWAGAKGGLGALDLVKQAKSELERALQLDAKALDGSAYTSLGSLYYQVPGWPIAFGDDDKAESLLKTALGFNPNGIDPNYFYGEFLYEEGEYAQALQYLDKAAKAPPRPGRESADKGRRAEIAALTAKMGFCPFPLRSILLKSSRACLSSGAVPSLLLRARQILSR